MDSTKCEESSNGYSVLIRDDSDNISFIFFTRYKVESGIITQIKCERYRRISDIIDMVYDNQKANHGIVTDKSVMIVDSIPESICDHIFKLLYVESPSIYLNLKSDNKYIHTESTIHSEKIKSISPCVYFWIEKNKMETLFEDQPYVINQVYKLFVDDLQNTLQPMKI